MHFRYQILAQLSALLVAAFLSSCHKADNAAPPYMVTEKDAAIIIVNHLLPQYGGLILQADNSLKAWQKPGMVCGMMLDSILTGINPASSYISYSYQWTSRQIKDCLTTSFSMEYQGAIRTEGTSFISEDQAKVNLSLKVASPGICRLTAGEVRTGLQRVIGLDKQLFNSTVNIRIDSLLLDSQTRSIIKGSATVKMTGTAAAAFDYSGVFTFAGGNKGALKLNSGKEYALTW